MKKTDWKRIAAGLLVLLLAGLTVYLVFRNHYREILASLRSVSPAGAAVLFALAALYQAFEALVCRELVRARLAEFSYLEALEVTFLGVFGNVATFAVGSIPLQSCRLHQSGLTVGHGVGIMTVDYIFHKLTILLYAVAMLLLQGRWFSAACPGLSGYLAAGCAICALVSAALVLVCTWERVKSLALRCIGLLPETEKWAQRKASWRANVESLYGEAQHVLKNRSCCGKALALNILKFLCLYAAVFLSIRLVGGPALPFWRVQLLSSVMVLISSALPNVAGIGPAEFSFLLIFSQCMDYALASSALLLYRAATYFFPFAVSALFLLWTRKRMVPA